MTKAKRNRVRQAIEDIEYYNNGFHRISGNDVEARNIKEMKDDDGETIFIADVIFHYRNDNVQERHNEVEYPADIIKKK
jgi:hypothetical protein